VPNHPAALQGLQLVRDHRSVEGQPNIIEQETQRRKARWDRTEGLYRQNEVTIRSLINDKQYAEARRLLATTRQLLDSARRDAQPPDRFMALSTALDSLNRYIEAEENQSSATEASQQRRAAIQKERERNELVQKDRDQRVATLFEQAMMLRKEREFTKAADVLKEIIAIDPTYERAKFLLDGLEDARLLIVIHRREVRLAQSLVRTGCRRQPAAGGVGPPP
jgi:tetratricopeptide (TPR) repeat protein